MTSSLPRLSSYGETYHKRHSVAILAGSLQSTCYPHYQIQLSENQEKNDSDRSSSSSFPLTSVIYTRRTTFPREREHSHTDDSSLPARLPLRRYSSAELVPAATDSPDALPMDLPDLAADERSRVRSSSHSSRAREAATDRRRLADQSCIAPMRSLRR